MSEPTDVVERAHKALDGITPAQWEAHHFHHRKTGMWVGSEVSPIAEACGNGDGGITTSIADADFIAAAPALVADLTAEVETLRASARHVDTAIGNVRRGAEKQLATMRRQRDHARAAIARIADEVQYLAARDQILIRAALDGEVQQ